MSSPTAGQAVPRIALTKFFAFGDSITWGEDGRNDASEPLGRIGTLVRVSVPYPALVQAYLQGRYTAQTSDIIVDNLGCRGEAAGGVSKWDTQFPGNGCGIAPGVDLPTRDRFDRQLTSGTYQAVLLMEGANDLGDPLAGINGLRSMIEDAKTRGVAVFLATIPPEQRNAAPGPAGDRSQPESEVLDFNSKVRDLALSERVTLVDVYNAFPSPDVYNLYGLLGRDGLHFYEAGYQLIAQTFVPRIEGALELPPATASGFSR